MKYLILLVGFLSFAQQTQFVDFKTINASLEINPVKRNVIGKCIYTFKVNKSIDTIRIEAKKMEFSNVKINNISVNFKENKKQLLLFEGFQLGENTLTFNYEAFPTQTMYFVNWNFSEKNNTPEEIQGQIWTQGQGRYTSHWIPSFDDVNEKVIFGMDITFQKSFQVISNGVLVKKTPNEDTITWSYQMQKPMSSYLLMVAIGHFEKQQLYSKTKIPLENYYEPATINKVEPTYRHSKEIFDFIESEIGYSYPWEIYRQIPVHDFLYAGMENTTSTLFSTDFVVDDIGFIDRNYINVNAHELAHQWFGNLVTAQSGKDHWLQEGFATYYALLAEKEIFGEDYFHYNLYQNSQQLINAAKKDSIPVLNEKASSLTFYQKGAWALHAIRESIGREKFNLVIKNYLSKYAFQNVTTDDFLTEITKVSDFDTQNFKKIWLEQHQFPINEANTLLKKNDFMRKFLKLREQPLSIETNQKEILSIIKGKDYYPIKELILYQIANNSFESKVKILDTALKSKDLHVRQAVAATLNEIPESFREKYETLLNDKSYETQEIALYKLWKQFPEHRLKYVTLSKKWVGFENKNLKMLHLSLAYLTFKEAEERQKIYLELLSYTGTNYDSNVRQKALEKLLSLKITTPEVLKSLVYGTMSPRWQFVKFSKDHIRTLLKDNKNRTIYTQMLPELPIAERTQLQRLLDEK
jgi:aminopeptidase N